MSSRERWLLTGAAGQLGTTFRHVWQERALGHEVLALVHGSAEGANDRFIALDLTNLQALRSVLGEFAPDRIFHCAAISHPARAQALAADASILHTDVTKCMAEYAAETGSWLLHCSTDFVFSGEVSGVLSEDDEARPLNWYGKTKLAGEQVVLGENVGLAARIALMYDPQIVASHRRPSHWQVLVERLHKDLPVDGVVDEWRTPLTFRQSAEHLTSLAEADHRGLVHIAGDDIKTPFDIISDLKERLGSRSLIRRVSREAYSGSTPRPANAALDNGRLKGLLKTNRARTDDMLAVA